MVSYFSASSCSPFISMYHPTGGVWPRAWAAQQTIIPTSIHSRASLVDMEAHVESVGVGPAVCGAQRKRPMWYTGEAR